MLDLDSNTVGRWVCEKTKGTWSPIDAVAIGWRNDQTNELTAGMIVDHWNGASCMAHVAISAPMAREFVRFCFGYLFGQLRAKKVLGVVAGSNTKSLRLTKHLGFSEECRIKEGHPDGDLVIWTMTPAQCRWIGRSRGREKQFSSNT